MKARCRQCNKMWNISTKYKIPKTGYLCPVCETKERYKQIKEKEKKNAIRKAKILPYRS